MSMLLFVQLGLCLFSGTPVQSGSGQLEGTVKFANHVRTKLCDDAVQVFFLFFGREEFCSFHEGIYLSGYAKVRALE
jgi:hypothetical protein